jgi:NOL1/NOP2/sun family putative RNA methylase
MRTLLIEEYEAYIESFEAPYASGLRINSLKLSVDQFKNIVPFELEPIPWIDHGFYYDSKEQPAKHPYYYAGLYYIQEPSAMTPAHFLPIEEGDKVLDLCAAPGGKTTELGAKLKGTGLLISNDISASRAKALVKNIELFGITNALITSESPSKLSHYFVEYFDKILVDAPCSGEGMFRKDATMIKSWEQYGVDYYHQLQKEIIVEAAKMLKPGGYLLYSTCTFSPEENEGTLDYLLNQYPEFTVETLPQIQGFHRGRPEWINGREDLNHCIRIWPHKVKGEGHFIALLKKGNPNIEHNTSIDTKTNKSTTYTEFDLFVEENLNINLDSNRIQVIQDKVYLMPEDLPNLKGLRFLRTGWYLGDLKKKRFEPSQAFAMGLKKSEVNKTINFTKEQDEVIRYLKGETLHVEGQDGWQLITVDGYPLGWGKLNKGVLKNKYYSGWRWM